MTEWYNEYPYPLHLDAPTINTLSYLLDQAVFNLKGTWDDPWEGWKEPHTDQDTLISCQNVTSLSLGVLRCLWTSPWLGLDCSSWIKKRGRLIEEKRESCLCKCIWENVNKFSKYKVYFRLLVSIFKGKHFFNICICHTFTHQVYMKLPL